MINKTSPQNKKVKQYPVILEILPLFLFFACSKYYDIMVATAVLIVTSIFNLIVGYLYTRTFHPISVLTAMLALVFGGLTLFFDNESFIKIKVTILNVVFALALMSSYLFKTNFLKLMFKANINLSDKGWRMLNIYWILFFIFLAVLNEIIWRHLSTNAWVNFKVFGILGLSFVFLIIQYPIIKKHSLPINGSDPLNNSGKK